MLRLLADLRKSTIESSVIFRMTFKRSRRIADLRVMAKGDELYDEWQRPSGKVIVAFCGKDEPTEIFQSKRFLISLRYHTYDTW